MRIKSACILSTVLLSAILPLLGDENLKPPAKTTTTQRIDFVPAGSILVNASRGDLYVEAWDQPVVELDVTKFLPFEYAVGQPERANQLLDAVKVTAGQPAPGEMNISTTAAARVEPWWPPSWAPNRNPVRIEYHIHVPRAAKIEIHHGVGLVSVSGVTGDIRATCHRGDIVLWLPESGNYAIDARNKLGKVSSDFAGRSRERVLVGQKFANANASPAQHLYLRMGFGGITLKPILTE
jgi:hypothetical protein